MADVSQENLAKAIFVHQPYIASLEAGNISIGLDKMEQIAAYFGVKYYHLADPDYSIPPRQVLRENIEKYIRSTQTESGYLKNESPNFTKSIDQILQEAQKKLQQNATDYMLQASVLRGFQIFWHVHQEKTWSKY
eukprot:gene12986-15862_t